jgi:endonuclease YncB( thermonuclease family)
MRAARGAAAFVVATLVALLLAAPGTAAVPAGTELRGKVVKLHDGDSFELLRGSRKTVGVRVFGIDCPERGQPWGAQAKSFTAGLIGNAEVVVLVKDVDRYGRTVGDVVLADGRHLSHELLRAGLAWYYRRYDDDPTLARLEAEARAARRGLWSEPHPVAPWKYRKARRAGR